ncbi:DUF177 domain-containing protein [Oenococcus sp. UCMA 14587]|nr:DUF177 domain-containing protein [Oenococcus sp. UCMA 14587]MDN6967212.1 DUF177 domain-containing protein [Oenococcus sp. UCMA 17063]
MKYLVQQLRKYQKTPLLIDETIDLSAPARENFSDRLLDLKPLHVTGEISYGRNDQISVALKIKGIAVLPSARSFNPVQYSFEIPMNELYVQDQETLDTFAQTEQVFLIERNQLDLDAAILENIITELPIAVYTNEELKEKPVSGKGWKLIDEEDYVEPESQDRKETTQNLGDFFPDNNEDR